MSLLDGLNTEDKSSLVNAINEILGKQLIAEAITEKGVHTSNSDLWQTMANNIRLIQTEDTTLRDSLASILEDEGVEVTEEDDMASLISKTDKEFQDNTTILYNKMKDANFDVDPSMNMDTLLEKLNFDSTVAGSLTNLGNSDTPGKIIFSKRNLNFTPSRVSATLTGVSEVYDVGQSTYYNSITVNSGSTFVGTSEYNTIGIKIVDNGFDIILSSELSDGYNGLGWTAINTVTYTATR